MPRLLRSLTLVALTLAAAVLAGGLAAQQPAKDAGGNVYVIAFVDATPNFAMDCAKLLLQFAAESKKDPGVVRFDVLRQDSRGNHYLISEIWRSRQAFEAHSAAEHTKQFREKLQPMLGSPYDERVHSALQ